LAGLTGLQYLDLTNTTITDVAPLAALTELRWLILRGTRADASVLAHLSRCQIITAAAVRRRPARN
jgi:Leucine-rich repeat (LRR) protein